MSVSSSFFNDDDADDGNDNDNVNFSVSRNIENLVDALDADLNKNIDSENLLDNVPKLVDDKRKHLQKRLSKSQREALFAKEAREEKAERKELREMMKISNEQFNKAFMTMGACMTNLTNSIANICQSLSQQPAGPSQGTYPYPTFNSNVPRDIYRCREYFFIIRNTVY